MRGARLVALGGIVLAVGALVLWGGRPAAALQPSGPYRVSVGERQLGAAGEPVRVRVWQPQGTGGERFPLILYAPGWGGRADDSAHLLGDLASHGYLAVAFDDVANDRSSPGEMPQTTADRRATLRIVDMDSYHDSFALASRRVTLAARKGTRVLDGVMAAPDLAMRIAPGRIGFVGYSFGGATGVEQAQSDRRLHAVVNLDGWLFGEATRKAPQFAYLSLYTDEDFPPRGDLTSRDPARRAMAMGSAFDQALHRGWLGLPGFEWLRIGGIDHAGLGDGAMGWNWRKPLTRSRSSDPHFVQIKRAEYLVVREFLDDHLKGNPEDFTHGQWSRSGAISKVKTSDLL